MAFSLNERTKEHYIKMMAQHFQLTTTEEELRKAIEDDPTILEDFVDWLEDGGKVLAI
jgi:hypothetical protein